MASASEEVVMDSNLSKEEGEITDDDEIDELLAENALLRQRERHHGYGYDTRVSRKYDVEASSSSSARQRDDSPSERYRGRDSHGSRHRHPYAESTRSGSCSSRQELPHHSLSYGKDRSSRDRYNQRDYHPPRNGQQLTPGSASSWRLRKFCPSSSDQNIAEDNHRPLSRHQEDTASESSLHPDYEKLLFEFRHVQERLKALKAQDEVEKTVPQAEVSSSKLSSAATDERRSTHHYDIVATPVKASSDSTRLDSPVVDETGKSDQGLSDISSQETDCFTDNSTGDQAEAGKENGPPSLTSVARVTTAGAVMGADIVSDTVTTAVVDLGVLPSPVENGDEGTRTDLPAAATSPPQVVEEEEDLDELELRRIALASAAARFKMTADDDADNEHSESLSQMKIHPMAKEPLAEAILPSNTQCQSEPTAGESAAKPKSKPASELASHGLVDSRQSGSRVSGTGGPSAPRSQVTKNNSAITSQSNKSSNRRASGPIFIPNSGTRKNERPRNGNRSSPHRKAPPKDREISSSSRSSRADREKLDPPRRSRPLPFAPVKLDRIRLTPVSPRAGGIRDAARKAQMRARQSSVARQLPKSTGSSTLSSSPNTSSDRRRARDSSRARKKNDEKKEEEERKQEIAKILSLDDPKEQAERFLRLLSGSLAETASPSKVQHLKDNYEEVEMDIDSSDEVADELRIDEFQSAMQPIQFVGADTAGFGITDTQLMSHDLSLAGGQWLASPYLPSSLHPFSGFANYTTPAPVHPPPPPPLPPLPADELTVPQPPKPPPPPSSQDTAAKNVGACVSDRPSLLGSSEMSESVSADISLAISYFRKSANSEYIPFISDAKFHEPHISFTNDAKSSKEYIPFISDGRPEEEHIPFISDAKPSDRQIPFISERSSNNGVGIPFNRADASASPVCLSSDSAKSAQGNRGNQAAYDLKFVSEQSHIEVSSPLMTGDAPSPALSPGETVSVLVVSDDKSSPVSVATTHQSGAETSPVVADDEEENEEELRAQLLQSILLKRKEAETKQQASSVDSSPSASVTASPQRLVVQKTKGVSRKVSIHKLAAYSVFPIHKPVVVTLGESSSEEEDAPPGVGACDGGHAMGGFDIDGFLKAQRKTVEKQTLPTDPTPNQQVMVEQARFHKLEQERQLRRQEMELGKQRQDIVKGQSTLQQLLSKASKFLADMKKAETRATHLREQLHTTERLIVRYRHLVQTSKTQAKEVRDSLLKKKEMYGVAEMSTLSLGRQLHGNSYKPRMTNLDLGVKRTVEVVSKEAELKRSQQPTRAKQAKLSPAVADQASKENIPTPSASQHTAQARKKEKERLQMLAKEYEEKIRLLKSMQAPKGVHLAGAGATTHLGSGKCSQQRASPHKTEKERLPSLETIKLEPVDGMVELEGKPRRRSLLDITHSPKPNLLIKDRQNSQDSSQTLKHKLKGGVEKTWTINFKMPSGLQLNNLCKIQREKMDKVLSVHTVECLEDFPHLELNCEPICGLKLHLPGNRLAGTVDEDIRQHKLAYTSPLLHFKAYRFSPYYRTKENLTISSASFSHKLNPNRILCRYDLSGTCNDQHCSWQHARDYSLSDKEVLMDLVAYCPQLAGVADDDSLDVRAKKIESYVDTLLSQHKGKMTTDELCLLLTARVSECAKHTRPHTMFYGSRPWRLCAKESGSLSLALTSQFQTPADIIDGVRRSPREIDTVLDVEDVRYFVPDTPGSTDRPDGPDMEGAVLATPTDTDLWLRLAYSKLSNPTRSSEECLNQALNVLSRGLENNKHSHDLWVHYLALYRRHPDSNSDFEDLCQTAIHCAPCYDIFWQLLEASNGFQAKDTVCTRALDFLCANKDDVASNLSAYVRSHQVLEMLLYRVTLNSQSGRFKTALNFVQSVLGLRDGRDGDRQYFKALTHADTCVLWICLVQLMEFQTLPASLYSPHNHNPGQIMSKEKLAIPWHSKRDLATPLDTLAGYLGQAVNPDPTQPLDQCTSPQYVQAVQNLAELLRSRKKCREACKILEEVLKWAPHLEDVWLTATDIYAGCHDYDSAKQVLLSAVSANSYSAKLHYHYVILEISQDCSDNGLEHMEQFVISHFDSTTEEMSRVDPNFLFCKLLALDIPVRKRLPPVKEELKEMLLQRDVYLWLCYCLLLELQGETEEAVDVFELALSSTTQAAHLALLWKCYVQFLYRRCQSSHSPATQSFQQQLQEAMFRSITTAPTLVPIRFPRQHQTQQQQWRDLSHVTNLVEFYVSMVPPDSRATALQTFYDLMPDNIPLLIRCVETALADGQLRRARSLCTAAVYDKTANLQLWKLVLALAQMEGTPKEVERLYVRAVRSLPLSVSLWKDFLLFEVSQENPVAVHTILAHCQDLGLNIQGYVATISATS